MIERGNPEQAAEFFERAIKSSPEHPNAYYGLALLSMQENSPSEALAYLDGLFANARAAGVRSGPLYTEARRLYLEANQSLASASAQRMMHLVDQRRQTLEQEGNVPIHLIEDETLEQAATAQLAWKRGRDHHLIKYRKTAPATTPHLVSHELEHLAMEIEARLAGRNRFFTSTAASREYAIRSIADHISELKRSGLSDRRIADYTVAVVNELAGQLYNTPLDMIIEQRLFDREAPLRPSQFVSLHTIHQGSLRILTDPEIKKASPREMWRARITLNCAMALFVDHLYAGRTAYADPYRQYKMLDTGRDLFVLWQDTMRTFKPGDEFELVDQFARVLRLDRWYEWTSEPAASTQTDD